jgi:amphi-Trp domain-containing protein
MPKDKIEFSGSVSADDAAAYLESLADGLRKRSMLLESGDTSINVEVAEDVKVELQVSADEEKGKSAIELAMSWRGRRDDAVAAPASLLIVAGGEAAAEQEPAAFAD